MLGWGHLRKLRPCGGDEGDCDNDGQCNAGLICGSNNCPSELGFATSVDCCETKNCNSATNQCNGDWSFCSSSYPCGEEEGDCDNDGECNAGLICGQDNCLSELGFASSVDCCIAQSSRKHRYFHPSRNVTSHGARLSHNIKNEHEFFIDKESVTDFASPFTKNPMPENWWIW